MWLCPANSASKRTPALVGESRDVGVAPTVAAGIFEPTSFVDIEEQLTHCVGRECSALLTDEQWRLLVRQLDGIRILGLRLSQTLVQIHRLYTQGSTTDSAPMPADVQVGL